MILRSPLHVALLGLLLALNACVDDFPTIQPVARGPIDVGPIEDADLPDARPPRPDAAPPNPDAMPPIDLGVPDMQPDIFVDPNVCRIGAPVTTLTLRTWNDTGASRVLELNTDCEDITVESPPWVDVTLDGQRLRFETQAARGVTDGVVVLKADDRAVNIDVRRIGLETGGESRRALIYVVDGLKGETIVQSAPEALEWLSKFATKTFDAVPHNPIDGATRATGWASLLTGLTPEGHGFAGEGAIAAPTFVDRVANGVFMALEWDVAAAGVGMQPLPRRDAIERAVQAMTSDAMLIIVGVNGLVGAEPNQLESRRAQIDADLDALLAGIAGQPADDDWLIIVTAAASDGEGPPDLPVLHAAPRLTARDTQKVTLQDVHTSVLGWLRVLRPGWDLPGAQLTGGVEIDCGDRADNDEDGRIDCRDADCAEVCPLDCVDADIGPRIGRSVVDRSMVNIENKRAGCDGRAAAPDLVVSWVAPTSSVYMLSTEDSNFDTMLDPLAQHCAGDRLTPQLECRDDPFSIPDQGEPANFYGTFSEGDLTQIFLTGYGNHDPGDVAKLHIVDTAAACRAAPQLEGEIRGDNLLNQMALPPFDHDGDTANACKRATANAFVRWSPPVGRWIVRLDADFDGASLGIWEGECTDLTPRFCRTDALDLRVNEPGEFLLVVSSTWSPGQIERGTFRLVVTPGEN